jgi:hypothetical protein
MKTFTTPWLSRAVIYLLVMVLLYGFPLSELARAGEMRDYLRDVLDSATTFDTQGAGAVESMGRKYYTGGTASLRIPHSRPSRPFAIMPPSINFSGCGGLSINKGALSYAIQTALKQLLQNLMSAAVAFAYKVALSALCGKCSQELDAIAASIRGIANLRLGSCDSMLDGMWDWYKNSDLEAAQKVRDFNLYSTVKGMVAGYNEGHVALKEDAHGNPAQKTTDPADTENNPEQPDWASQIAGMATAVGDEVMKFGQALQNLGIADIPGLTTSQPMQTEIPSYSSFLKELFRYRPNSMSAADPVDDAEEILRAILGDFIPSTGAYVRLDDGTFQKWEEQTDATGKQPAKKAPTTYKDIPPCGKYENMPSMLRDYMHGRDEGFYWVSTNIDVINPREELSYDGPSAQWDASMALSGNGKDVYHCVGIAFDPTEPPGSQVPLNEIVRNGLEALIVGMSDAFRGNDPTVGAASTEWRRADNLVKLSPIPIAQIARDMLIGGELDVASFDLGTYRVGPVNERQVKEIFGSMIPYISGNIFYSILYHVMSEGLKLIETARVQVKNLPAPENSIRGQRLEKFADTLRARISGLDTAWHQYTQEYGVQYGSLKDQWEDAQQRMVRAMKNTGIHYNLATAKRLKAL